MSIKKKKRFHLGRLFGGTKKGKMSFNWRLLRIEIKTKNTKELRELIFQAKIVLIRKQKNTYE